MRRAGIGLVAVAVLLSAADAAGAPLGFEDRSLNAVSGTPVEAFAADLSGDNRADAYVLSSNGGFTTHTGYNGLLFGSFFNGSANSSTVPRGLGIGRIDEDGLIDSAYSQTGNGQPAVAALFNRGDGFWTDFSQFGPVSATITGIAVGRATLDFFEDPVVLNTSGPSITAFPSNGDRTFAAGIVSALPPGSQPQKVLIPQQSVVGPFEPDAVITATGTNTLIFAPGNGSGGYGTPATQISVPLAAAPDGLALGNVTGNATTDAVLTLPATGRVQVVDGNLHTAAAPVIIGGQPADVAVGQLDGASGNDLAIADPTAGTVRILLGNGAGGFTDTGAPVPVAGVRTVQITDVDGDGRNDIFAAGTNLHVLLTRPVVTRAPASIDAGTVTVGEVGAPQTVTFTNTGGPPLVPRAVRIGGSNPEDFVVVADNCTEASVGAGQSCNVGIRFAPTTAGGRAATVGLLAETSDAGSPSAALSGVGVAPSGSPGPPATPFFLALGSNKLKSKAGKPVRVEYVSTTNAAVTLTVKGAKPKSATITANAAPGANSIRWNGKLGKKAARPGKYTLTLTGTSSDGQTATDTAKLKLARR